MGCYNWGMDVFITPEAGREIEALKALRPKPGTWGAIVGHRRGTRFIVEKILAGGDPGAAPDDRLLDGLEKIWPGRVVGIVAVRPGAALRKALLGPAWYGKLVLAITGTAKKPALRPAAVEFEKRFFLSPVPLAPAGKVEAHE
jgi:hypothetical protein